MAWEAARSLATEFNVHEALLSEPLRALIRRADYETARQQAQQARAFLQSWWQDIDALLVPAAPALCERARQQKRNSRFQSEFRC